MIHRAYRTLNDPPKLLGFTGLQWFALVVTGALAIGATQLIGVPAKPAISFCALILTTVAAIAYAAEPGGVQPLGLVADSIRMAARPRGYAAGMPPAPSTAAIGLLVEGARASVDAQAQVDRAAEVFAA